MEYKEKKYIVRKLMQNALTEEEQTYLSASKPVSELMEQQWENVEDSSSRDSSMESTLLKKINTTLDFEKNQKRRIGIYKCYSLVSSLLYLLCMAVSRFYVCRKLGSARYRNGCFAWRDQRADGTGQPADLPRMF